MKDVISIKDFYNHETRLTIVENAIVSIDKRFDQVDKHLEKIEIEMKSNFNWLFSLGLGLAVMTIGFGSAILTVVAKAVHWF